MCGEKRTMSQFTPPKIYKRLAVLVLIVLIRNTEFVGEGLTLNMKVYIKCLEEEVLP